MSTIDPIPPSSADAFADSSNAMRDAILSAFGVPAHLLGIDPPALTGRAALYQAILDHPEDDLPRMVYADWLDDYGSESDQARAEFIRLQLEMALRCRPDLPLAGTIVSGSTVALKLQEIVLVRQYAREWCGEFVLPGFTPMGEVSEDNGVFGHDCGWKDARGAMICADFHRGFISRVSLPQQAWLDHGKILAGMLPLERVELADADPSEGKGWYCPERAEQDGGVLDESDARDAGDLHPAIWDCLSGDGKAGWRIYDTVQTALDDLSNACLLFARKGC